MLRFLTCVFKKQKKPQTGQMVDRPTGRLPSVSVVAEEEMDD